MKRIQFAVDYPERFEHPLHRAIREATPISRAELLMWSPTADAETLFWFDAGRAATDRAVQCIDSLRGSALVEDANGTYAFLRQAEFEFPTAVLDAVAGADVIFLPPVVFSDTGPIRFEAVGEPTALSTFYDELSKLGNLTIERAQEFERRRSRSRPTDRQQAALEAAVSVGYYEVPRTGTVADVADALDCSKSTAGELVRKAEAAVVRAHVQGPDRQ